MHFIQTCDDECILIDIACHRKKICICNSKKFHWITANYRKNYWGNRFIDFVWKKSIYIDYMYKWWKSIKTSAICLSFSTRFLLNFSTITILLVWISQKKSLYPMSNVVIDNVIEHKAKIGTIVSALQSTKWAWFWVISSQTQRELFYSVLEKIHVIIYMPLLFPYCWLPIEKVPTVHIKSY